MIGKLHHRQMCFVDSPEIVHYTWFAISETFCGRARSQGSWGFGSSHVTCVACLGLIAKLDQAHEARAKFAEDLSKGLGADAWGLSSDEEWAILRAERGAKHGAP